MHYTMSEDNKIIMNISQAYQANVGSFSQYKVPRAYENTRNGNKNLPHSFKSRQTFVADIQNLSKKSPGVGAYTISDKNKTEKKRSLSKINFTALQKEGTHTYLDDIIKLKNKVPSVGKYNPEVDHTQEIKARYKTKNDKQREKAPSFRPTVMDTYNVDAVNVAPGCYDSSDMLGSKSILGSISPSHKRSASLPKIPSACDYTPIPVSYDTFERKSSLKSITKNEKSTFGSEHKFKAGSLGPGPKYSLISEWSTSKNKYGRVQKKDIFKSVSKLQRPGVYH